MSPLPLLPAVPSRTARRLGGALLLMLAGAATLGAGGTRAPQGVTLCATGDAGMAAASAGWFAAHPAHGPVPTSANVVTATFKVQNFMFNADNNPGTPVDTVRINIGESVQYTWVSGMHTITSGSNGDIDAGSLFNLPADVSHMSNVIPFPTAGTFPFFCQNHTLNNMKGVVVVTDPAAGVGPDGRTGAGFVSSPAPNPTTGRVAVRFAVAQGGHAVLTAFDAGGRAVGTLFDRDVAPGTYSVAWTGRSGAGQGLAPGAYFLRLTAPGIRQSRRITIVR